MYIKYVDMYMYVNMDTDTGTGTVANMHMQ
jgi:hypothetical protein